MPEITRSPLQPGDFCATSLMRETVFSRSSLPAANFLSAGDGVLPLLVKVRWLDIGDQFLTAMRTGR